MFLALRAMLPKKNRTDTKGVNLLFKEGRFIASQNLTFKFILTNTTAFPRISFIAPKSIAKLAVKRNSLRRRGYRALQKHINDFPPGILGAFIFRKYQDNVSIIEDEIKKILSKINWFLPELYFFFEI